MALEQLNARVGCNLPAIQTHTLFDYKQGLEVRHFDGKHHNNTLSTSDNILHPPKMCKEHTQNTP